MYDTPGLISFHDFEIPERFLHNSLTKTLITSSTRFLTLAWYCSTKSHTPDIHKILHHICDWDIHFFYKFYRANEICFYYRRIAFMVNLKWWIKKCTRSKLGEQDWTNFKLRNFLYYFLLLYFCMTKQTKVEKNMLWVFYYILYFIYIFYKRYKFKIQSIISTKKCVALK